MPRPTSTPPLAIALAVLAGTTTQGCAPTTPGPEDLDCPQNLLPGDLVITEIFADAEGSDEGLEWFEVYNATGAAIDLAGVELVHSRSDDSGSSSHVVADGVSIAPGEYLVLGGVLPELAPAHVDYAYANDLGPLRNSDGKLAVRCNVIDVDVVAYAETVEGASWSLDGTNAPNATTNDTEANFCAATVEDTFGGLGTPGRANEPCESTRSSSGQCNDGGMLRDPIAPALGAVVISELMANPDAVADGSGEWIELLVTASFDLNGLELGRTVAEGSEQTVDSLDCLSVSAGDRLVLANNPDPAANGGVIADFALDVTLTNSNGSLFVGHGGDVLDELTWTSVRAGAATALAPQFDAPADNDNPDHLCDATTPYGDGDLGTPGAVNDACGDTEPPPTGDTCLDGETMRAIVAPRPGDLVITEFMPDPDGTDGAREWFEITALAPVDLVGLQAGRDTLSPLVGGPDCRRLAPGELAVFARSASGNGGLPVVTAVFDFSLIQDNGTFQIGHGDVALDTVSWGASATGASFSLDPDATDPDANDDGANYCLGATAYGEGGLGTPGVANPSCPDPL